MQLFHNDAVQLMMGFLESYLNSTLYDEASKHIADYYYQKRDYKNAVLYYETVDIAQLRKKDIPKYKFQYAYSLFEIGEMKSAASFFTTLFLKVLITKIKRATILDTLLTQMAIMPLQNNIF